MVKVKNLTQYNLSILLFKRNHFLLLFLSLFSVWLALYCVLLLLLFSSSKKWNGILIRERHGKTLEWEKDFSDPLGVFNVKSRYVTSRCIWFEVQILWKWFLIFRNSPLTLIYWRQKFKVCLFLSGFHHVWILLRHVHFQQQFDLGVGNSGSRKCELSEWHRWLLKNTSRISLWPRYPGFWEPLKRAV